jgi:hypothetical protein
MSEFKMPTEVVELPSKGLIYPEDNPLSSGKVEMKYMTAKEEDILTNQSYIQKGIVIDKLLKALIVSDINYDDLIVGDKNAILIAARVLGYGGEYSFEYFGQPYTVDLATLENKEFDENLYKKGENNFSFELPSSGAKITFKLLTGKDEKAIDRELAGLKKINKESSPELTTRLKHIITSVNGDDEAKTIRDFVDNHLLARDSRALREHIRQMQPDVEMSFIPEGEDTPITVPMTANFLYPDI